MTEFEVNLSKEIKSGEKRKTTSEQGAILFDASAAEYVRGVVFGDRKLQSKNAPKVERVELREWDPDLMVD